MGEGKVGEDEMGEGEIEGVIQDEVVMEEGQV